MYMGIYTYNCIYVYIYIYIYIFIGIYAPLHITGPRSVTMYMRPYMPLVGPLGQRWVTTTW